MTFTKLHYFYRHSLWLNLICIHTCRFCVNGSRPYTIVVLFILLGREYTEERRRNLRPTNVLYPVTLYVYWFFSSRWVQRSGLYNIAARVWRNQSNFYRNVRLFLTEKKLKLNNIEHPIVNIIQNLNRFFIHYFSVFESKLFSETSRKIVGFTAYSFFKHLEIIMWYICTVYTDSPLISFCLSYCKRSVVAVFAKKTDIISFL